MSGWFHVSPHRLAVGDVLVPSGGASRMALRAPLCDYVWVEPDDVRVQRWAQGPHYTYRVTPAESPVPFNGTGAIGWTVSEARVAEIVGCPDD